MKPQKTILYVALALLFVIGGSAHAYCNIIDLGTLGGTYNEATGINASGQVAGDSSNGNAVSHAFLYSGSKMIDLGTLGGQNSYACGINDSGQNFGDSSTTGDAAWHAFLYSGSTMTDLGTLGGTYSYAWGINASGQVVGDSDGHAFLYSGSTMTDLNTLIDPASGWTLRAAEGINDAGQIVGCGYINGQTHAFLLDTPEPTTLLLLGLGGLALRNRK
jgi:probable HAF family extracellular repeat protein